MNPAHADALELLLIVIGLLIFAIALPFILKAFKKDKPHTPKPQIAEKKPAAIDVHFRKTTSFDDETQEIEVEEIHSVARDSEKAETVETKALSQEKPVIERVEEKPKIVSLEEKLKNTKSSLWGRIRSAFDSQSNTAALEQVEEILYTSDIGPKTVENLLEKMRIDLSASNLKDFNTVSQALKSEMASMIVPLHPAPIRWNTQGPTVILVLGVNGVGKTTTIGKLAALWAQEGKKVLVAAGDTFRAAAASQLKVWSERAQVEIFAPEHTKDPSGVAFEAVQKAAKSKIDVVIVDTAGRLHTQDHLMEELKKIKRVVGKALEGAPHEAWIVLDANSGQNALIQAKQFNEAVELTGAVVTKMDGTAKGGVIVGLHDELKIPVKKIGVGEKLEDLRDFNPEEFLNAIL